MMRNSNPLGNTLCFFLVLVMLVGCNLSSSSSSERFVSSSNQIEPLSTKSLPNSLDLQEVEEGKIVFVSDRDGNEEIYVMNIKGGQQIRLTHNEARDYAPSWSPDGKQVVFVSNRDGNGELYTMMVDGRQPLRLTNTSASESNPRWSPDGQLILFDVYGEETGQLIESIDMRSGQIVEIVSEEFDGWSPSWSSDGRQILFVSGRDHENIYQNELYVINLENSDTNRLSNVGDKNIFVNPVWSPDGQQVAFSTLLRPRKIFTMDIDTLEMTQLIAYEEDAKSVSEMQQEFEPSWSPDGEKIVFSLSRDGNTDIYILELHTKQLTRLTDNPASDLSPDWWSP